MTRLFALVALLLAAPLAHAQRMPATTSSDAARAHFERGLDRLVQNNVPAALAQFDAAVAADPGFALARAYRASVATTRRPEDAQRAVADAARATDAERDFAAATTARVSGDDAREAELLTALAARYPGSVDLPIRIGYLELNRNDNAAAIAAARRALAADPSLGAAYNVIGYAEAAQGNWAAAETALREYARLSPDEANPYDSMGEILHMQGRLDDAEAQFQMALTRDPAFASSRAFLTRIAIERAFADYVAASNAGDVDAYVAHYTPTAVLSGPTGHETVGAEALRANVTRAFAQPHRDVYETIEIRPMGDDHVYHRARYRAYEGERLAVDGIDSFLWVRTPQGWKIARDTWTSSVPPPTRN